MFSLKRFSFNPMYLIAIGFLVLWSWGEYEVVHSDCHEDEYKAQITRLEAERKQLKADYEGVLKTIDERDAALHEHEDRRKEAEEFATKLQERVDALEKIAGNDVCFRGPTAGGVRQLWDGASGSAKGSPGSAGTSPAPGRTKGVRQPPEPRPAPGR